MNYPEITDLELLERKHSEVSLYENFYEIVDELVEGGEKLRNNIGKYLSKKPEEDQKVYDYRKKLFTYTPVLTHCLNQLENRLTTASYAVEGLPKNGKEGKEWNDSRENLDLNKLNERDFFKKAFNYLLKYRQMFILVDMPNTVAPTNPINLGKVPYLVFFSPKEVIDYHEEDNQLQWIKIKRLVKKYNPLEQPEYYWEWTIIDAEKVVGYQLPIDYNEMGQVRYYRDPFDGGKMKGTTRGELWGNQYNPQEIKVKKIYDFEHGLIRIPVLKAQIKQELWVTNQAIFLCLEHIRIANNLSYTGQLAGMVQRIFTPLTETINDFIDLEDAKLQVGNDKVLIGNSFNYAETTGSAISTVSSLLDRVEQKIKDVVFSVNFSNPSGRESGRAKAIDQAGQEKALESYGKVLVDLYEEVLKLVAEIKGVDSAKVEKISVSGLSEFVLDTVESKLEKMQQLQLLENPLSKTARLLLMKDLLKSLLPHIGTNELITVNQELDDLYEDIDTPEYTLEDYNALLANGVISKTTVRGQIGLDNEIEEKNITEETIEEQKLFQAINPEGQNEGMGNESGLMEEDSEEIGGEGGSDSEKAIEYLKVFNEQSKEIPELKFDRSNKMKFNKLIKNNTL